MGLTAAITEAAAELRSNFAGSILLPRDQGYDEARRVHNGLIDKRPALIARCRGTADIADAVVMARDLGLEIAVRSGGHNVAGRATVDHGIMIDLSAMRGVHVDHASRTALAESGVTWGQFNRETQLHALATTGGAVSTTGIAGLTLGGGLGWLMGKYGLAADNLLSVEMVTADGKIVRASDDENSDLFWAVRGAGANFGVVSHLEYRLHEVGPAVTGGIVAHTFENARDVLRFYRETCRGLPDEMIVFSALLHAPDGSGNQLAAMAVCHCGPLGDGESAVRPIKGFGSPVLDTVGPIEYCSVNTMLDAAFPKGALNYWKSSFMDELSDEAIDAMVRHFSSCPAPMGQLFLEHWHGAVSRVDVDETAVPHRSEGWNLLVLSEWIDPAETDKCIAWARDTYESMSPFLASGRYVNYLDKDEAGDAVAAAYGPNYRRLQELKAKWDPDNAFHMNQNIRPLS